MKYLLKKYYALPGWSLVVILILYYLLVVLPHEQAGQLIASIFDPLGRNRYNSIILFLSVAICLGFIYLIAKDFRWDRASRKIGIYAIVTLALCAVAYEFLFTLNIEFIHYIQYALFAILCFPLCLHYYKTWIWASLAGIADELYQYLILAPQRTQYFDFNDVIMNMLGAALGLILIKRFGFPSKPVTLKSYFKSFQGIVIILTFVSIVILWNMEYISLKPGEKAFFALVKKDYPDFWSKIPPNVMVHIIKPLEGVIIMAVLSIFYSRLDD